MVRTDFCAARRALGRARSRATGPARAALNLGWRHRASAGAAVVAAVGLVRRTTAPNRRRRRRPGGAEPGLLRAVATPSRADDGDRRHRAPRAAPCHRGRSRAGRPRYAASDVEIRRLTTGRVRGKRRTGPLRYLPGGWNEDSLPVHAFAVEHPDGICLFDTGQTARASAGGYHPGWHPFFWLARFELKPEDEVASQIDARTVRWVVLSHLHTDHVGGLSAFTHAEVFVSRLAWECAQGLLGRLRGYIPQHWPQDLEPHVIDPPHDVAGDGRLLIVSVPGHTPGHAGLVVEDETLLAGDAIEPGEFAGTGLARPRLGSLAMRAAVVGLGWAAGEFHLPALQAVDTVELVGGADPSNERRDWWAKSTGSPAFASIEELIGSAQPELVVVGTPPDSHADLCIQGARSRGARDLREAVRLDGRRGRPRARRGRGGGAAASRSTTSTARSRSSGPSKSEIGKPDVGRLVFCQVSQLMDLAPWDEPTPVAAGDAEPDALRGRVPSRRPHARPLRESRPRPSTRGTRAGLDASRMRTRSTSCCSSSPAAGSRRSRSTGSARRGTRYIELRADCEHASLRASYGGRVLLQLGDQARRAARHPPRLRARRRRVGRERPE